MKTQGIRPCIVCLDRWLDGKLIAQGTPKEVIARENIRAVTGMENEIIEDPVSHAPLMVPVGRQRA